MSFDLLKYFDILSILDIAIVAYLIYRVLMLIQGTRAVQLLKGVLFLLAAAFICRWLGLYTINWLLDKLISVGLIAIPVVFQPELRKALEQLGRGKFFSQPVFFLEEKDKLRVIEEINKAVVMFSKNKIGALIVIEKEIGLQDYIASGITMNAVVSAELLVNVFIPNTPLHDGAAIVRGNQIIAANCLLPLTDNEWVSRELGTRHRSALGITEVSDAVAIVVSEETGVISLTSGGKINRYLDEKMLLEKLLTIYNAEPRWARLWQWRSKK